MRRAHRSLLPAALLLAAPVAGQEVEDCATVPLVTALVEPWEETSVSLGEGAIRIALLEDVEEGVSLVILTLPPPDPATEVTEVPDGPTVPLPPVVRRCRLVAEGGVGFAMIDLSGLETTEDPEAATLTAEVPALRFVPETTQLEEGTLRLVFGVRDDSLRAEIEAAEAP